MNKSKEETILNNLIDSVEKHLDNEYKLKKIYYDTVKKCKNIFGVVDKRYYKKWLSEKDYNQYIRLKSYKYKLKKIYFNSTIEPKFHQTEDCYITVHHINEIDDNIPTNLSDWKYNTKEYWCYHFKYNLVYCDLMFHYFLHIIIMWIKNQNGTNLKGLTDKIFNGNIEDFKDDKEINQYKYITKTYSKSTKEKLDKIYQKVKEKTWQNQKNMI